MHLVLLELWIVRSAGTLLLSILNQINTAGQLYKCWIYDDTLYILPNNSWTVFSIGGVDQAWRTQKTAHPWKFPIKSYSPFSLASHRSKAAASCSWNKRHDNCYSRWSKSLLNPYMQQRASMLSEATPLVFRKAHASSLLHKPSRSDDSFEWDKLKAFILSRWMKQTPS